MVTEKTISKSFLIARSIQLSISDIALRGDVVGTDTIKSILLSLFKNFIACIHVWISGELSFANFEGLTNGTSALFFRASLI